MTPEGVTAVLVAVVGAWALLVALLFVVRPRDVRLVEVVRLVPDVVRLTRNLLADRSVPVGARLALVGLLVWLISPIDLIPEFIPIVGPLDDVVVLVLVLRYVRRRLGDDEFRSRWPGTDEGYRLLRAVMR